MKFELSSTLDCSKETIQRTLTMEGVNAELGPLVRMTAPPAWQNVPIPEWPEKEPLFKSWILLFGLVPIDRHSFYFDSVDAGGFSEASSSWMNRLWRHTRQIDSVESGVRVKDAVEFELRLPFLGRLLLPIYKAVLQRRHRYLRRMHGGSAS